MRRTSNYLKALPLAAALLAGCDVSPLEVETASRNRMVPVEDERELEVFFSRRTSPVDTVGGAATSGARGPETRSLGGTAR